MKKTLILAGIGFLWGEILSLPAWGQEGTPPVVTNISFTRHRYVGGPQFVADSYSPPLFTAGTPFNPDTDVATERDILIALLTIFDPDFHDEDSESGECGDTVYIREFTYWFPLSGYFSGEPPPFVFDSSVFCCGEGFCPPAGDTLFLQTTISLPEILGSNQARLRGLLDEFGNVVNWDARVIHDFEISNEADDSEDNVIVVVSVILKFAKNPVLAPANPQAFADAGPDMVVESGSSVKLDGGRTFDGNNVGFDANSRGVFDKDNITYSWQWISGPERVDPIYPDTRRPYIGEVTLNEIGTYVFRLTADDGVNALPTSDNVRVQVISTIPENRAPIARASGPTGLVTVGSIIRLDGTASFDPDGDSLTYSWQQTDEIGGAIPSSDISRYFQPLSGTTSPIVTWQAIRTGTYYFRLLVNDGEFVSSTRLSVQVTDAKTAGILAIREAGATTTGSTDATDDATGAPTNGGASPNGPVTPLGCGTGAALGVGLASASLATMRRRKRT